MGVVAPVPDHSQVLRTDSWLLDGLQAMQNEPLEVTYGTAYKEVTRSQSTPGLDETYTSRDSFDTRDSGANEDETDTSNLHIYSRWWTRRRNQIILTTVTLLLAIVIIVPTVLKTREVTSSPEGNSNSSTSTGVPAPTSTSGYYSGTGIGAHGEPGHTRVFFQHPDGAIWQSATKGDDSFGPIITEDVKRGTALACTSYKSSWDDIVHIVYQDQQGILQDMLETNHSGIWRKGDLGLAQLIPSAAPRFGLSIDANGIDSENAYGNIRLFFGDSDRTVREWTRSRYDSRWQHSFDFPDDLNGAAGIAATHNNNYTYIFGSNHDSMLSFYVKEMGPSHNGTWTQGTLSDVAVGSNGSICLPYSWVAFQDGTNTVHGVEFDYDNFDSPWGETHYIADGLPGTMMEGFLVWEGGWRPAIVMQSDGSSIAQYTHRNTSTEHWDMTIVRVN